MSSIILCIESSYINCSVSLSKDDILIGYNESLIHRSHDKVITCLIDDLMNNKKISFTNISAICINQGPGLYTGLRVGISVAKAICFAIDKPLIAIKSLIAMYYSFIFKYKISKEKYILYPIIYSKKDEIYTLDKNLKTILLSFKELNEIIKNHPKNTIILFGYEIKRIINYILPNNYNNIIYIDDYIISSKCLIYPAFLALKNDKIKKSIDITPMYI
ncbi:MAG: tRNA (adenosine(37)-N6)-threonylcarbamoyltransferase complex dimerization subunit type 1 TsaB [Bacteroides sp.]|nr:MAG: tRNA (adenosine(37)-N6)-threonylcarbamoyltransferase complex dimerization subunit type 1 TsaB [Bacteroides sp.]